jgi:hypothetical protein
MRQFLVGLASIIVVGVISGCQSGIVGDAIFSKDRHVVAFTDENYPKVYLASGSQVWQACTLPVDAFGNRRPFLLNPSGTHLLVIGKAGTILYDVAKRNPQAISVPSPGPGPLLLSPSGTPVVVTEGAISGPSAVAGKALVDIAFLDETGIAFGVITAPLLGSHEDKKVWEYWTWRESEGWRKLPANPPPFKGQWQAKHWNRQTAIPGILQLGPEGGKPRRTVWLKDDGSVVELLRQNDLAANIPVAVVTSPLILTYYGVFLWASIAQPTLQSMQDEWPDISEAQFQTIMSQMRTSGTYTHPHQRE